MFALRSLRFTEGFVGTEKFIYVMKYYFKKSFIINKPWSGLKAFQYHGAA